MIGEPFKLPQDKQRTRPIREMVQGIVDDGLADGSFRPCDGKVVTYSILSLLSTVHRWSKYVGRQPAGIADEVASIALNGLVSGGATKATNAASKKAAKPATTKTTKKGRAH